MRRYRYEIDNVRSHLRSLWIVITLETLVVLVLSFALIKSPEDITVHIPPDLRSGATMQANVPSPPNVYAFAFYIFQQLHRWPENGAEDFSKAIFSLAPYLTSKYRASLIAELELKGKRGELAFRERGLQEVVGHGFEERRVDILKEGVWLVWLDLELYEAVQGMDVKKKRIRYPLRVVRHEYDLETNPWGLALDGFANPGPQPLDAIESVEAS